mmetsp:Transcript_43791/g.103512  ORF Transcript_43791/g.103512 Transcript_43791/m.103512 type:complete len:204 (-) Transcript_43791:288-899(-)
MAAENGRGRSRARPGDIGYVAECLQSAILAPAGHHQCLLANGRCISGTPAPIGAVQDRQRTAVLAAANVHSHADIGATVQAQAASATGSSHQPTHLAAATEPEPESQPATSGLANRQQERQQQRHQQLQQQAEHGNEAAAFRPSTEKVRCCYKHSAADTAGSCCAANLPVHGRSAVNVVTQLSLLRGEHNEVRRAHLPGLSPC